MVNSYSCKNAQQASTRLNPLEKVLKITLTPSIASVSPQALASGTTPTIYIDKNL